MRTTIVAIFTILLCGLAHAADTPQSLTLAEAQRIALANHPQIKESDYEAKASEESIAATRSGYYPQISGNAVRAFAGENTRLAATGALNNPTVIDRGSAGIGVSQLITDFGRTDAQVEATDAAFEAQKQRTDFARATILFNATRAYYNVLRAAALLKVAEGTLKTRQTLLDQVTRLRDVQMKSDLDLSIAKQGIDDANLLMLKAENGRTDAIAELSETLGTRETRDYVLADGAQAAPLEGSAESYAQKALAGNPELAALQSGYEAARREAEAAEREYYPTLSAVGFAGDTPIRTADQHIDPTYAAGGISLSIPIFTGGRITADAHKAEAKAEAAKMLLEVRKNTLVRDIRTVFDSVATASKNIAVAHLLHENASKSLELTQARYDIGKSSIVDLNQAKARRNAGGRRRGRCNLPLSHRARAAGLRGGEASGRRNVTGPSPRIHCLFD
jgi:outer membrane protein